MSFPTATATATRRTLPPFTEEHEELRESIRRFVENELRPHAREWEDARWFPSEVFTRMAVVGDEPKQAGFGLLILARPILGQVFDSQSRKMLVELTVGLVQQPE